MVVTFCFLFVCLGLSPKQANMLKQDTLADTVERLQSIGMDARIFERSDRSIDLIIDTKKKSLSGVQLSGVSERPVRITVTGSLSPAEAGLIIRSSNQVRELNFEHLRIDGDWVDQMRGLKYLSRLDIRSHELREGALTTLATIPSLKSLSFCGTGIKPAEFAAAFPRMVGLEELAVRDCPLNDSQIKLLFSNNGLRSLRLEDIKLSDQGIEGLRNMTSLRFIELSMRTCTEQSLIECSKLPNLNAIILRTIHYTGVPFNSQSFKELRFLEIDEFNGSLFQFIDEISEIKVLDTVRLPSVKLDDASLLSLAKLKNLRVLDLRFSNLSDSNFVDLLSQLKNLTVIDIRNTKVSPSAAAKCRDLYPNMCIVYDDFK